MRPVTHDREFRSTVAGAKSSAADEEEWRQKPQERTQTLKRDE
jgi:hypothetical protein